MLKTSQVNLYAIWILEAWTSEHCFTKLNAWITYGQPAYDLQTYS